jgi:hypothetical protein
MRSLFFLLLLGATHLATDKMQQKRDGGRRTEDGGRTKREREAEAEADGARAIWRPQMEAGNE